jgi:hypothetical protein
MKPVISGDAILFIDVGTMAGVVQNGQIMFTIMFFHEPLQFSIKTVLWAAITFLQATTFIGQVNDFGVVFKLVLENGP